MKRKGVQTQITGQLSIFFPNDEDTTCYNVSQRQSNEIQTDPSMKTSTLDKVRNLCSKYFKV